MIEEKKRALIEQIRKKCSKTSQPGVSIITSTNKSKYMENIFTNYARSSYPHMELIIILNNNKSNINDYKMKTKGLKNIRIFQLDESYTLGECLNFGIEQSKYSYVSKMDDDDYYGTNYLLDLMNVFKYTDAQLTGKNSCFVYFEYNNTLSIRLPNHENRYVHGNIAGGTITFKKEIFQTVKFKSINKNGTDVHFLRDCNSVGIKMFSADKYNYVYMKHKNPDEHTWKISSEELMKRYSKKSLVTTNFIPFVTI